LIEIPARRGKASFVQAGQVVDVINTHGEQVVDTWAFSRNDLGEFLSNEHTRARTLHMTLGPGDILRSNRRRPILTLIEDTSGGVHDTLIAPAIRIAMLQAPAASAGAGRAASLPASAYSSPDTGAALRK
jgi:uncharacterized protein